MSLPTVVVFPVPFTPTMSVMRGGVATVMGRSTAKTASSSCFTVIAQAETIRGAADRVDDAVGRRDTDIRRDEKLFERVNRVDIDRAAATFAVRRTTDDVFEPIDDLLLGA